MSNKCSICLEHLGKRTTYITECNHVFHDSCVQTWKTYQKRDRRTCPTCRTQLSRLQEADMTFISGLLFCSLFVYYFIYYIRVREEIHDYGMCQFDAQAWCANQGYTWYKSETMGPLCNIDYCYRITYNFNM